MNYWIEPLVNTDREFTEIRQAGRHRNTGTTDEEHFATRMRQ